MFPIAAGIFLVVSLGVAGLGLALHRQTRQGRKRAVGRLRGLASQDAAPGGPGRRGWFARPRRQAVVVAGDAAGARGAEARTVWQQAGITHPQAAEIFLAARVTLAVTLAAATGFGAHLAGLTSVRLILCLALAGAWAGAFGPSFWLAAQVRERRHQLRAALPDMLDMLVLCVEGGLSLNGSVQRVTDELHAVHPLLAAEMDIVQRSTQLGISLGQALRDFADRCGLSEVRDLAVVYLQAERFGASVTTALRAHAEGVRLAHHQKAKERAQKAAVKILFPTLLFIFPAIFMVVLGPAAFQMAALFKR
jgi:tight adherence protein C